MPEITGTVHHLNLSVADLDRSVTWYQKLFGLNEIARLSAEDGSWSKVILCHPNGLLIGLTQHHRNNGESFDEQKCGVDHFALVVADLEELTAWKRHLDRAAVDHSQIKTTPLGSLITVRDPDNIQFELYTPAKAV